MAQTAAKWGAAVLAGAGVALGGMMALANKTAAAADEIDKMSIRTGISRKQLQELRFITSQTGVSFEAVQSSVARMTMTMGQATEEGNRQSEAFARLGVQVRDSSGELRSADVVFNETLLSLAGMENETERNALAMEVFGRGAIELVPLLAAGADGIEDLTAKAHELGLVMTDDAIAANVEFADMMDQTKRALGAVWAELATALLPMLNRVLEWVIAHIPQIREFVVTAFTAIGKVIEWLGDNILPLLAAAFQFFSDTVVPVVRQFWEVVAGLWDRYGEQILAVITVVFGLIQAVIRTVFGVIRGIFDFFLAVLSGDWEAAWDAIKSIFEAIWNGIKDFITIVWGVISGIFSGALGRIHDAVSSVLEGIRERFETIWTGIVSFFRDTWGKIVDVFKGPLNAVIDMINRFTSFLGRIRVTFPQVTIPFVGTFGGWSVGLPSIAQLPRLAAGGDIEEAGWAMVGERGPEILHLPQAARVSPLPAAAGGGTANITVLLDGYMIARAIGVPLTDEIKLKTGFRG